MIKDELKKTHLKKYIFGCVIWAIAIFIKSLSLVLSEVSIAKENFSHINNYSIWHGMYGSFGLPITVAEICQLTSY